MIEGREEVEVEVQEQEEEVRWRPIESHECERGNRRNRLFGYCRGRFVPPPATGISQL